MEQVAPDVFLLDGFPKHAINIYLMGDVLLDAGARMDKKRILRQLQRHSVTAHALTHVHPDHQGASKAVCETLDIPLWCPEKEVAAMESGDYLFWTWTGFARRPQIPRIYRSITIAATKWVGAETNYSSSRGSTKT